MQNLSADDIAFIQSSYRDAKSKASQARKLRDLYPDVTPAQFAQITGTLISDWTGAKKKQISDDPETARALDCLVFGSFDALVELSRDRGIEIEVLWREALQKLENRLLKRLRQTIEHPVTAEYEMMIVAILVAGELDAKKKCSEGAESQQSTEENNTSYDTSKEGDLSNGR